MADFAGIRPPASADHRYFKEDIPYGLVFLRTLGERQGIAMPICDAVITLSSVICKTDFRQTSPFDLTKNRELGDLVLEFGRRDAKILRPEGAAKEAEGPGQKAGADDQPSLGQDADPQAQAAAATPAQGQRTPAERGKAARAELEAKEAKKQERGGHHR